MEYDINEVPIEIEGVNISSLPSSSGEEAKNVKSPDSSDENEDSEGIFLFTCVLEFKIC